MKKYKNVLAVTLCFILLIATLTGCGNNSSNSSSTSGNSSNSSEKQMVWKIGHIRPSGAVADLDVQAFAKDVLDSTNGKIKIEIYPSSQLGDYAVVQERVSIGDVEMQIAPTATAQDKALGLSNCPYLVTNWEEAKTMYKSGSKLIKLMEERFDKINIKLLATYPLYFGGIALTKEPKDPTNISVSKGLKIRVPQMKSYEKCAEALGYMATPLGFSETFTAMQTGIVEGAIGAGAEGYYSNFKDLIKYYLPLNDHFEMWYLYISKDLWNKLSPEDQEALQQAALRMEEKRFKDAETQQAEYEKKLQDEGITVINFTPEQLAEMREKIVKEVWPVIKDDYGAEIFESIIKDVK